MHLPNVRERHCVRKAANLAVLLLCCAAAASAQLAPRPLLVFHGNVLFDDVVYRIETTSGEVDKIKVGREPHGLTVWPQPGRYSLGHTGNLR